MPRYLKAIFYFFLLLCLLGCVISPRRTTSSPGTTGTGQLYIANQSANSILRFSGATAINGNIPPRANISGASTQLSAPSYIFLDVPNDRLYVANFTGGSIVIFDKVSTLNGDVAPARVITSTNLVSPIDVAVDTTQRDLLYVADNLEVAVFAAASTANGLTSAIRVIQPGFTPGAILLDATNDRLFIADPTSNAIDVFENASTLNGSVTPIRSLTGTNTQLSQPDGLIIDGAGRLIVSNFFPPSITIYANAATITGNVAPLAVISGSNSTLAGPAQLTIDPTTNSGELYVADSTGGHVPVFSNISTVAGTLNPVPNRNLTGANTQLSSAGAATAKGITLDTTR